MLFINGLASLLGLPPGPSAGSTCCTNAVHERLQLLRLLPQDLAMMSPVTAWHCLLAHARHACCREHLLHERNAREAAALHAQLLHLLPAQGLATREALSPPGFPAEPSVVAAVATRLKHAILAGHLDQASL